MHELEAVLAEARALLARPDNDFCWSSWADQQAALAEIDMLIAKVRGGRIPKLTLDVIFMPTGPMQEVSLSSGWADEFLGLAQRYDDAMAAVDQNKPWWKFW